MSRFTRLSWVKDTTNSTSDSRPCRLMAVTNGTHSTVITMWGPSLRYLWFWVFGICQFFYYSFLFLLNFFVFCSMCCRTLTNGSHSDYQVRTWFVLFAPNLPSCRHDKEGRALSYTVFSTDWRPTGPSDWGPVLSIWLSTKGPSWENHTDETWEVSKSQNCFFRSDRGQPYKHFASYLTGIYVQ